MNSGSHKIPKPPPPIRSMKDEFKQLGDLENVQTSAYIRSENLYFQQRKLEWSDDYDRTLRQLKQYTATAAIDSSAAASAFEPPPEIYHGFAYFLRDGVYYKQKYSDVPPGPDSRVSGRYVHDRPPHPTHTLPQFDLRQATILLDTNEFPPGVSISNVSLSADHSHLGYVQRQVGEESGLLCFKDLRNSGAIEYETIGNVVNFAWMNDGRAVVYTDLNPQLRPHKVYAHRLGTDQSEDRLLFEEPDDRFFVDVSLTKDKKYVTVNVNSRSTSEVYIMDASIDFKTRRQSESMLKLISKRRPGIEYFIDSHGDSLFIVTNAFNRSDFTLATASMFETSSWRPLLQLDESFKLEDVDVFDEHVVLYARKDGLPQILVHEIPTAETHLIPLPEPLCAIIPGVNKDFHSDNVRFSVTNAGNLEIVYEYRFKQKSLHILRQVPIPGYHRNEHLVCRAHVQLPRNLENSRGGGGVSKYIPVDTLPVTLYHRSDVSIPGWAKTFSSIQCISGSQSQSQSPSLSTYSDETGVKSSGGDQNKEKAVVPVLVTAYSCYGIDTGLPFDPIYQPLLDDGWVIAACHGIGGSEYGKEWSKLGQGAAGKLLAIEQITHFVDQLYKNGGDQIRLAGLGISAGGCIMGSVFGKSWLRDTEDSNKWKQKFKAMVLHVPFLDPMTAMQDPLQALTTTEHEEWGNPLKSEQDEELIARYSPYELIPWISSNSTDSDKPFIFITGGLMDKRVPFWHPLKYAARMRSRTHAQNLMMLIREDGGHFEDTSESSLEDLAVWLSLLKHAMKQSPTTG